MPQSVILGTARTPFGKMGGALASLDATELGGDRRSPPPSSAPASIPSRSSRSSSARSCRPARARSPRARRRSRAASPRRSPRRRSTRSAPRACARSGCSTRRSAPATSRSPSAAAWSRCRSAPYLLPGARFGFRMGDVSAVDAMTHDGLTNPFTGKQMINEASEVGNELEITRADMDRFAVRSHELAAKATEDGKLAEEIVPVTVKGRKGDTVVEADEAIRPDTTLESLAGLRAIGGDDATHTAGNAPGVNDGAGAVVVASEEWADGERPRRPRPDRRLRSGRRRLPLPGQDPGEGRDRRAREDRQEPRGRRPLGDQRGLRLGRAQLAADARHRRGQGQRQRRRDRPRPSDRRLRRPDRRRPRPRAPAPRRRPRLRRDLLGRRPGRRDPDRGLDAV